MYKIDTSFVSDMCDSARLMICLLFSDDDDDDDDDDDGIKGCVSIKGCVRRMVLL
jgi:hypothetical protein